MADIQEPGDDNVVRLQIGRIAAKLSGMFIHNVYFWLNDNAPAEAAAKLEQDCRKYLAKIPTVKYCWAGTPAGTDRPVVDNSYAVGLTVILEDSAGHDVYQTHPLHLEFIERNKPNWKRVQVYDHIE